TCSYAKQFSKKTYSIDNLNSININDIKEELSNTNKYDEFKYQYLTYKDEINNVFDIIENELLVGR
ncbi:MAG: hypothetical protein KAJ49_09765, partial [Arcobacteraceae bacterium]|nr:hypothetical protein [Arcobacteraceae bacterium]